MEGGGGRVLKARNADNLTAICEPSRKYSILNLTAICEPSRKYSILNVS
jgi:hypothetical protein